MSTKNPVIVRRAAAVCMALALICAVSIPLAQKALASSANERTAWSFLLSKGLGQVQVAGIIGNLDQESGPGIDPTIKQVNPNGTIGPGRGIAQWSTGGRWDTSPNANVNWYAQSHDEPALSLDLQLNFIWFELSTMPAYGLAALQKATTVQAATIIFMTSYEICGTCASAQRITYAQAAYNAYSTTVPAPAQVSISTPRLAVVSSGNHGTLYVKDGDLAAGFTLPPSSDHVVQASADGSRIVIATTNQTCWGRDNLSQSWILLATSCLAAKVSGSRVAVLSTGNGGTLYVRDGPLQSTGWTLPPGSDHVTQFALQGSRIVIATSNQTCWGRDDLTSAWTLLAYNCTDAEVSGPRVGVLSTGNGGSVYVRDGTLSSTGWTLPPSSDHIVQFALDGQRIAATTSNNICWARDSIVGGWTQLANSCTNVQLSGNRIGVLSTGNGGTAFVRDGIGNTDWTLPAGADHLIAFGLTSVTTSVAAPTVATPLQKGASAAGGLALANVAVKACSANSLGGSAFYSSCTGNGGSPEYWCADFVKWVWANSGFATGGLTAGAISFKSYGITHNTLHAAGYVPLPGDAIVYNISGSTAQHVGIVASIQPDGTINTVNGDFGGVKGQSEAVFASTAQVKTAVIPANSTIGSTPAHVGMTIGAIVSPSS